MADTHEFWTGERISRLECTLQRYQSDAFAQILLQRLRAGTSQAQKRQVIEEELVPALLRDRLAPLGIIPAFVTADADLLLYAASEGLPGENPNMHP